MQRRPWHLKINAGNAATTFGVTVTILSNTATGWTAKATHGSTTKVCNISLGGGATNEGEPVCA